MGDYLRGCGGLETPDGCCGLSNNILEEGVVLRSPHSVTGGDRDGSHLNGTLDTPHDYRGTWAGGGMP